MGNVNYYYAEPKPYSPQYVLTESHRTSETYIRSHCIISWLIWWQRVRSIVFSLFGPVPEELERLASYFALDPPDLTDVLNDEEEAEDMCCLCC